MTCNKEKESHFSNSFLALLAGVGAGVAVGLMIAPKSGRKLRADIGNTVDGYMDSATQSAEDLRKNAAKLARRGLREVQKTPGKAAEKVRETINGAMEAATAVIDRAAPAVRTGMQS
jgi:gas vesicle protein